MKATLRTRCGCERVMAIPFPPNPIIILPLRTRTITTWKCDPVMPRHLDTRTFELMGHRGGPEGTAEYAETEK